MYNLTKPLTFTIAITFLLLLIFFIIAKVTLVYKATKPILNEISDKTDVTQEPPRHVYLGAWVGGFWNDSTRTINTSALTSFEQNLNKKMAIANIYTDWTFLADPKILINLNAISDKGWTPMISSNPKYFSGCPETKKSLYKAVSEGDCDKFLKQAADNLRSYKKPIFLRFAWEMNLPQMYWSVDFLKSTPDEFKSAWQHLYNIFQTENASNVVWVLSFNTSSSTTIPYAKLYPGDDFVDWVAIDGYNWGNAQSWSNWTDFSGVFRKSYDELTIITDKPVMLSEVNSVQGVKKSEWIKDMLTLQIPQNYPQVEAIIFFNENKITGENVDWRLETDKNVLIELRKDLDDQLYKSNYP